MFIAHKVIYNIHLISDLDVHHAFVTACANMHIDTFEPLVLRLNHMQAQEILSQTPVLETKSCG